MLVRPHKHSHGARLQVSLADLFGRSRCESRYGLFHVRERFDLFAKTAGTKRALLRRRARVKSLTGDAAELFRQAQSVYPHLLSYPEVGQVAKIESRHNIGVAQPFSMLAADAPDLFNRSARKSRFDVARVREVQNATGLFAFLGNVIGGFRQGLCRRNADRDRDAGVLINLLLNRPAKFTERFSMTVQGEEGFVDGIDFHFRAHFAQGHHHSARHIAVEGVVRRFQNDVVTFDNVASLKNGNGHFDAQGFGFIRARYDATVEVGEDYDRSVAQSVVEDALARDVKIVAIDQRKDVGHGPPIDREI